MFLSLLLSSKVYTSESESLQVVTEEWLPYNYTNVEGQLVGRSTDKVRAVLSDAGIKYKISSYPWLRSMHLAKTQANTMIYSIYRTPERENLFQWVCPLMGPVKEYLFALKTRDDIKLNSLEDAKKYVISIVRGSVSDSYLTNAGFKPGINLDLTSDPGSSPRKLVAGRVDFILQTEYTASERMKELGYDYSILRKVIEVKEIDNRRACMAFSLKTDKSLVQRVQSSLDKYNKLHGES
ncbi:ABC transporter substrate-binding protein [Pseudoalteromonas phenolica]|nr:ABC transporter substrate-binding protein [Pseudoalteromonas phenolica]